MADAEDAARTAGCLAWFSSTGIAFRPDVRRCGYPTSGAVRADRTRCRRPSSAAHCRRVVSPSSERDDIDTNRSMISGADPPRSVRRSEKRAVIHHRDTSNDIATRIAHDGAIALDPPGITVRSPRCWGRRSPAMQSEADDRASRHFHCEQVIRVRSPPRSREQQPESFAFTAENLALGKTADRQISGRPPSFGGHPVAVARPGTGGRVDPAQGDRICRRPPRHATFPCSGGGDFLYHVPARSRSAARRTCNGAAPRLACCAAARRSKRSASTGSTMSRSILGRRGFLLGGGRVPGRLLSTLRWC